MSNLNELNRIANRLDEMDEKMPLLFVGHGNPMNAIEENEFTLGWKLLTKEIKKPKAILCISAHWETRGTFVTAMENPRTIHDFAGFPKSLFDVEYPAKGNYTLSNQTKELVQKTSIELDNNWGLDHGCWSVLNQMYPEAEIPVLQMSIDFTKSAQWHYDLANEISVLRNRGVLILGSGNMIHNLGMINWQNPELKFDWAEQFNDTLKSNIFSENHDALINYSSFGEAAALAIPTPEHYLPLLYILGLKEKNEGIKFFNDKTIMGSISMTSLIVS